MVYDIFDLFFNLRGEGHNEQISPRFQQGELKEELNNAQEHAECFEKTRISKDVEGKTGKSE